jgi:hypothetical protein
MIIKQGVMFFFVWIRHTASYEARIQNHNSRTRLRSMTPIVIWVLRGLFPHRGNAHPVGFGPHNFLELNVSVLVVITDLGTLSARKLASIWRFAGNCLVGTRDTLTAGVIF